MTNVSSVRSIGNPLALHAGEPPAQESWQHVHLLTLSALRDILDAQGLTVDASWGAGYQPLPRRLAARLAALDPSHAHFITAVARGD